MAGAIREHWTLESRDRLRDSLAVAIRRAIEDGRVPPDGRLPPERALAERLGVSRTTVVAAYAALVKDGLLARRTGSGTFVSPGRLARGRGATRAEGPWLGSAELAGEASIDFRTAATEADEAVVPALQMAVSRLPDVIGTHGYVRLGWGPLRRAIAEHLTTLGLRTTSDQVLVTTGAQQAIDLVVSAAVGSQDAVVVENPTYPGALDVLRRANAQLVGVPVGISGVRSDQVREAVAGTGARLLYLQPTFSNPTGAVISTPERQRLADLAAELGLTIVEDLAFSELEVSDVEARPLIAGLARPGAVLCIGSLNKLCWGGLRLGWIRGTAQQISRLANFKSAVDLSTSLPIQMAGAYLLPRAEEVRQRRREQLRARLAVLEELLARWIPDWRWATPSGGMVLWVRLPTDDAEPFARLAHARGVDVVPGSNFSVDGSGAPFIRIPFCRPSEVLEAGVRRLAEAWRDLEDAPTYESAASTPLV
ncbi:MAG: PLP-dependent aminotransferase family protein [Candidatus Dormibacteraeota bacterium]|nr:PLP-dependent aminotransferase family protein [Candidatus Dormibacteraeota bacterium]